MRDTNGHPLSLGQSFSLTVRFSNTLYQLKFLVAERVAIDVIIGAAFINHYVLVILCTEQRIGFKKGQLSIVKQLSGPLQEENSQYFDTGWTPTAVGL